MSEFLFDMTIEKDAPHTHVIVDFANLFFRSYHAYRRLNDEGDFPVSHLYGSFKILASVLKKTPGDFTLHFAMEGYPRFRYELLPSYKEGRGGRFDSPDEKETFTLMKQDALKALRMVPSRWYWHDDFEADDIIASLVNVLRADHPDDQIWILSSDKDLWGLVDERVTCFGNKSEAVGIEEVKKHLGVGPEKVCLYKAFFGDQSDKIPRIHRVRSKVLLTLIDDVDSVEEAYQLIDEGKFKLSRAEDEYFQTFREQASTNYKVASLQRRLTVNGFKFDGESKGDLEKYLKERKCPSLVKDLGVFWGD
jgi:DNA polymerase-1